jgi:hypothetical protein
MPRVNKELSSMPMERGVLRARIAPLSTEAEKRQAKALKDLMDKRAKAVKETGVYPNYNTN